MQLNIKGTPAAKARAELKTDAVFQALNDATPAQIEAYLDNNINNLNDAKLMFKRILLMIRALSG